MRQDLEAGDYDVNVVAVNIIGAESSQQMLVSRASFDLLQDVVWVNAWTMMGGGKDDFFIYREGGTLAPGGYLGAAGPIDTDLSSPEGYANVLSAIQRAHDLGAGEICDSGGEPAAGAQRPGDFNQDGSLNLSDAVSLLRHLFSGSPATLPCKGEAAADGGNRTLLDSNGDARIDLADAVYVLNYLFTGGSPPVAGVDCVSMSGCPEQCRT